MARKLDPKLIKARIKENRVIMKEYKAVVTASLAAGMKGEEFYTQRARYALSRFIKASKAVRADAQKLTSIQE